MVALTADRNTPEALGTEREGLLGAAQSIFIGSILMRNVAGQLIKGATALGSVGVGRAEKRGTSVGAGVTSQRYRSGVHRFANQAGDLVVPPISGLPASSSMTRRWPRPTAPLPVPPPGSLTAWTPMASGSGSTKPSPAHSCRKDQRS